MIQKGRQRKPINLLVHGVHKIGKSTLGSKAPKPIFVTGEEIEEVDADKFPKCHNWDDFIKYLTFLRDEKHDYKTLVIDTLDSIESLLHTQICKEDKVEDMAHAFGGFGKGYTRATQMMIEMRDDFLVPIRDKRNMNMILLCHSTKNKFEDPLTQTQYDVYEMKLHKNGKGYGVYTVFSEWVSIIAFANFEVFTVKNGNKDYAVGDGERRIFLTPKPSYDAGNRFDMPDELPMEWSAIEECVDSFYAKHSDPELEELKNEINSMLPKIKDGILREKTIKNVASIGNDKVRLTKAKAYISGAIE